MFWYSSAQKITIRSYMEIFRGAHSQY